MLSAPLTGVFQAWIGVRQEEGAKGSSRMERGPQAASRSCWVRAELRGSWPKEISGFAVAAQDNKTLPLLQGTAPLPAAGPKCSRRCLHLGKWPCTSLLPSHRLCPRCSEVQNTTPRMGTASSQLPVVVASLRILCSLLFTVRLNTTRAKPQPPIRLARTLWGAGGPSLDGAELCPAAAPLLLALCGHCSVPLSSRPPAFHGKRSK